MPDCLHLRVDERVGKQSQPDLRPGQVSSQRHFNESLKNVRWKPQFAELSGQPFFILCCENKTCYLC